MSLVASALICCAMTGTEREKIKPAVLCTMLLMALGSTLFTIISSLMAEVSGDKSRIAAQIVTGIGFLGAGAIMHDAVCIRGLTTAAMIWVIAAIGMLCGAGFGGTSGGFTGAVSLLLHIFTRVENCYLYSGPRNPDKPCESQLLPL